MCVLDCLNDAFCVMVKKIFLAASMMLAVSTSYAQRAGQDVLTKFTDKTTYLDWVPIYRYAETLLNLSECYYNTNQPGKAIAALKEVRRRSISADADPIDIDALSGDALKEAIYLERRAELVGEAIRATDIKRRCETFVKKKGTAAEFSCDPNSSGYTWPIPTVETANNKAIVE